MELDSGRIRTRAVDQVQFVSQTREDFHKASGLLAPFLMGDYHTLAIASLLFRRIVHAREAVAKGVEEIQPSA